MTETKMRLEDCRCYQGSLGYARSELGAERPRRSAPNTLLMCLPELRLCNKPASSAIC
jgi:hypothetical protein